MHVWRSLMIGSSESESEVRVRAGARATRDTESKREKKIIK